MKKTKKSPKLLEVFAILSGDFILENRFFAFSKGGTQENWKMGSKNGFFHFFSGVFDHFWSKSTQINDLRVQITVIRGFEVKSIEKLSKSWFLPPNVRFFWPKNPGNPCRFWRSFLCIEKVRCNLQVYIYNIVVLGSFFIGLGSFLQANQTSKSLENPYDRRFWTTFWPFHCYINRPNNLHS